MQHASTTYARPLVRPIRQQRQVRWPRPLSRGLHDDYKQRIALTSSRAAAPRGICEGDRGFTAFTAEFAASVVASWTPATIFAFFPTLPNLEAVLPRRHGLACTMYCLPGVGSSCRRIYCGISSLYIECPASISRLGGRAIAFLQFWHAQASFPLAHLIF